MKTIMLVSVLVVLASCRGLPLALSGRLPIGQQSTEQPTTDDQLQFICDFQVPDDNLVQQLNEERKAINSKLRLPPSTEKIYVNLYRDVDTYNRVLSRKFPMVPNRRAFFVETDMRLEVYAHWSNRYAEDLRHEVAHGFLHAAVPAIPLWIDEGLAEYFEVPGGNSGFNRPHLLLLSDMMEHNGWEPNIKELESLAAAGDMQQIHYAEAWAWAYFLLESTPERHDLLTEYLQELRAQGNAKPLSERLASLHVHPNKTLAEFLVALKAAQPVQ